MCPKLFLVNDLFDVHQIFALRSQLSYLNVKTSSVNPTHAARFRNNPLTPAPMNAGAGHRRNHDELQRPKGYGRSDQQDMEPPEKINQQTFRYRAAP
jgi:hypothetical protein